MKRLMLIALLLPTLALACAAEDPVPETESVEVETTSDGLDPAQAKPKVPFCPAGEVRSCTLGPPPVCTCKPKPVDPVPVPTVVARAKGG